jgi:glycosyltransferase involved in cell wall biosynthesis
MNVVIVNDFAYVNGGASKIALGSAVALAGIGHKVTLFAAVGPVSADLEHIKGLTTVCLAQYEIVNDPSRIRAVIQGFWNAEAEGSIRGVLAGMDPANTIVHVHMWTKALSSSVVRMSLSLGFKVVVTLHDYFAACPTGTLFNHPEQAICELRPMSVACICSNCDSRNYAHKLWRIGRQLVQSRVGKMPSGVTEFISISQLSEDVLRPLLAPTARIHRVRNFVDAQVDAPCDVASNVHFCFSGRMSPEKGPMMLAECSRALGIDALFIGDGPLRKKIEEVAPKAVCTGWLPAIEATAHLRRSRALVFPSLWFETQGLVVAEAAAIGIPAIVPDTCAAREWVDDGVSGLWFRGGDMSDLSDKIRHLSDNPAIAASMGLEAYRKYWRSPATVESHAAELESVYQLILSEEPCFKLIGSHSSAWPTE